MNRPFKISGLYDNISLNIGLVLLYLARPLDPVLLDDYPSNICVASQNTECSIFYY